MRGDGSGVEGSAGGGALSACGAGEEETGAVESRREDLKLEMLRSKSSLCGPHNSEKVEASSGN